MRGFRGGAWLSLLLSLAIVGTACGGARNAGRTPSPSATAAARCSSDKLSPAQAASAAGAGLPAFRLAQAKPTLTIGTFGDRTGDNAQIVLPSNKAMQLAINQANQKADLPVTLAFKPLDNRGGKGDTAIPVAQQLIGDPSVVAVLGGAFSAEVASTGRLFSDAGLLFFTAVATRPDLTESGFKTFFRGVANDNTQGSAIISVFKFLGCNKVAVVDDKSAYGAGLGNVAASEAKNAAMNVVLRESIEPTTDYTSLVDSVLSKNPEALFYAGYASEFQVLAKQLRDKGYEGVIASGDGSKSETIGRDIGVAQSQGIVLTCPCPDINISKDPAARKFVSDYKAAYNENPGIYAAEGYDVANVTIDAIRRCGTGGAAAITRACVVDKVRGSSFQGVTKKFEFSPNGQVKTGDVSVFVVRNGKVAEVGPAGKITQ